MHSSPGVIVAHLFNLVLPNQEPQLCVRQPLQPVRPPCRHNLKLWIVICRWVEDLALHHIDLFVLFQGCCIPEDCLCCLLSNDESEVI